MIPTVWTTSAMASAGLADQAPARDTVLVMVAPSGIANASEWALFALVLLGSVSAVALLVFLWRLDRHGRRLTAIARQMEGRSRPVLERAAGVADNLDAITRALRAETRHLTGSVRGLSDRLRQASAHMETRIDEFNALLEVVQAEAEDTFVNAASAVRGVGAGARALEGPRQAAGPASPAETDASRVRDGGEPVPVPTVPGPDDAREPSAEAG